jgi:hypothetical protein
MNEPTIGNLIERLNHLERQYRWSRRMGTVVIVAIAGIVMMGQAKPVRGGKIIEADAFVLRDSNGKVHAILGIENNTTFLRFYDNDGRPRIATALTAEGNPALSFVHKDGKPALTLSDVSDKTALHIFDKNGNSSVSLVQDPSGPATIALAHQDKTRVQLIATEEWSGLSLLGTNENPKVLLCDCGSNLGLSLFYDQKPRLILGTDKAGFSHAMMFEKDGKMIWKLP